MHAKDERASVSAILTTGQRGLLLQLRDDIPGIEYPGYWSLLGGWIESGESPGIAIRRELKEELGANGGYDVLLGNIVFLGSDDRSDRPWTEHTFHSRVLTPAEFLFIKEGRKLGIFTFDQCSELERLAPHHRRYISRYRRRIESMVD